MLSQEQVREPRSTAARHGKTVACSLCAAHETCSHQAEGQEQLPEPQVCRWATPPYDLVGSQLNSSFELACAGFFRSRDTDMLLPSQLPQKMMPCHGTSSVATVHHSISSTNRFTRCPSVNPSSMSWLPLGIVRFFAFVHWVFLGKGVWQSRFATSSNLS